MEERMVEGTNSWCNGGAAAAAAAAAAADRDAKGNQENAEQPGIPSSGLQGVLDYLC
jgi:hypothetical protein